MSFKIFVFGFVLSFLGGCASTASISESHATGYALKGTETVVVGVPVDKNGVPEAIYEKIVVYPGQKIIFAGPDRFSIFFKGGKYPNKDREIISTRGVVLINIPLDILDRREYRDELSKNNFIKFNYGIRVGNKELDPEIIVKRRN